MNMMTIQETIRSLREETGKGMNQTELGKKLGMSQMTISRLERGETNLRAEDIKKYCKLFQVSANYILGLPESLEYPKR